MNKFTRADLYRYDGLVGPKGFLKGCFDPGFRYTFILRKIIACGPTTFSGIFLRVLRLLLTHRGFEISYEAQIGPGLSLYHRGSVFIGPIKIGRNCTIAHNVTIGRTLKEGKIGRPTLGDNVWVGTGAVVVGRIDIGNDVLIAPNAFVNFDIPDHSLVIGNPGKIYPKANPTKYYITFTLKD